jgi:transposase
MDERNREGLPPSVGAESDAPTGDLGPDESQSVRGVRLTGRRPGGAFRKKPSDDGTPAITPSQRIVLLDVWSRSGLSAADYGALVGVTAHTLYEWKRRFERDGPAGLMDRPRGSRGGSRLPEATQRAILLMKSQQREWGTERIRDVLMRAEGYGASAGAIGHVTLSGGSRRRMRAPGAACMMSA